MVCLCLLPLFLSVVGAIDLHVPDIPVTGLLDDDVTLPCWFFTPADFSLNDLSLIWKLAGPQQVHAFYQGQDQLENQDPNFKNRTSLYVEDLQRGNMSLHLQGVRLSDEGTYKCFVNVNTSSSAALRLQVAAAFTKPTLHLEQSDDLKPGDQVTVTCHSYHGYPEADLLWQDGEGRNLTENITTSQVANEEGLFHVQSSISFILETSNTYTCLVYNPLLNDVTHASLTVTGQHLSFPPLALWVTVGLCACLVALLVALACVCRKQLKQTCEEDQEEAGNEEQEENGELKTAMQPLKPSTSGEDDDRTYIE
ncbi:CD276 antigen isoform X2 [Bombina bombina]|uniref:CD276 antigen isoform X2 n=1 Tax=Bombina bombina TaxID=8345 RepID=UPI00235ABE4A|nr:CD276 antigen isoform X2 [Bombina bombina]